MVVWWWRVVVCGVVVVRGGGRRALLVVCGQGRDSRFSLAERENNSRSNAPFKTAVFFLPPKRENRFKWRSTAARGFWANSSQTKMPALTREKPIRLLGG